MTKKSKIIILLAHLIVFMTCSPRDNKLDTNNYQEIRPVKNNNTMSNYFPFEIRNTDGQYFIIARTESPELYPEYADFFEKYDYTGNGYTWEGHITQILEKLDKELLNHITFDPEAGCFYSFADTKENQIKFVELLSPIFSDLTKLESYIVMVDRSRIDN